jgi:NitT/TauT family transport system substrate-binding protein
MESGDRARASGGMKTRILFILIYALGCHLWAAPGGPAHNATRITLRFDSPLRASQAPYYLALEKGWYASAGLEVMLSPGVDGEDAVRAVESGEADIGAADVSVVLAAVARGTPVKIIATVGDKSPICTFSISGNGVEKPLDMEGKKIAVDPFDEQRIFFPLLAREDGIHTRDIAFQPMEFSQRLMALATGSVDATFGTLEQAPELGAAIGGGRLGRFLWADFGFDLYGACLFTRESALRSIPSALRAFLSASFKAWEYALRHPDQAVSATAKHRIVSPSNLKALTDGLSDAKALFDTPLYRTKGIGYLDADRMEKTMRALTEFLGVPVGFTVSDAMTKALLPSPPVKMPAQKPKPTPKEPAAPKKAPPESGTP